MGFPSIDEAKGKVPERRLFRDSFQYFGLCVAREGHLVAVIGGGYFPDEEVGTAGLTNDGDHRPPRSVIGCI